MTPRQSLQHMRELLLARRRLINESYVRTREAADRGRLDDMDITIAMIDTELKLPAFAPSRSYNRGAEQVALPGAA